ncbi:unnamed protein product, partial [Effrenium voratum]
FKAPQKQFVAKSSWKDETHGAWDARAKTRPAPKTPHDPRQPPRWSSIHGIRE